MNGGAYEYVAGYVDNGHSYLQEYGSVLVNATDKYKDVYRASSTNGNDNQSINYSYAQPTMGLGQPTSTSGHYGDAVWETSGTYISSSGSWYSDFIGFPNSIFPFFNRGGSYGNTSSAGVFYCNNSDGDNSGVYSFRVVIPVL